MMQRYGRGWFNEQYRHSLAAKGIRTSLYAKHRMSFYIKPLKDEDLIKLNKKLTEIDVMLQESIENLKKIDSAKLSERNKLDLGLLEKERAEVAMSLIDLKKALKLGQDQRVRFREREGWADILSDEELADFKAEIKLEKEIREGVGEEHKRRIEAAEREKDMASAEALTAIERVSAKEMLPGDIEKVRKRLRLLKEQRVLGEVA
jgi:hypothetical protein